MGMFKIFLGRFYFFIVMVFERIKKFLIFSKVVNIFYIEVYVIEYRNCKVESWNICIF